MRLFRGRFFSSASLRKNKKIRRSPRTKFAIGSRVFLSGFLPQNENVYKPGGPDLTTKAFGNEVSHLTTHPSRNTACTGPASLSHHRPLQQGSVVRDWRSRAFHQPPRRHNLFQIPTPNPSQRKCVQTTVPNPTTNPS